MLMLMLMLYNEIKLYIMCREYAENELRRQ